MSQRVAVSKQGVDVLTETDPNQYIFHSDYNTFKILREGTVGGAVGTPSATYEVAHNMGIAEPFYAFMYIEGAALYEPLNSVFITNASVNGTTGVLTTTFWQLTAFNNAGTLTLNVNVPNPDSLIIKYFIFARP